MNFWNLFNFYGLIFAAILVTPHIVWAKTHAIDRSVFDNRAMLYIARTGRFFSAFLMGVNIGVLEKGFPEPQALMERFWLIVTGIAVLLCALLWVLLFKTERRGFALAISLISAFAVIFSGIVQVKTLLMTAGIVYLIGEIYLFIRYYKS